MAQAKSSKFGTVWVMNWNVWNVQHTSFEIFRTKLNLWTVRNVFPVPETNVKFVYLFLLQRLQGGLVQLEPSMPWKKLYVNTIYNVFRSSQNTENCC